MAIKRVISTGFWTDKKVVNEFTPEDKLFYIYLLTNPHTTQLGIYEFVPKIAAFELGYSTEAIMALLDRFENRYGIIRYSKPSGEIAIKNYLRHSIVKGGKPVLDCLRKEEKEVSDKSLLYWVKKNVLKHDNINATVVDFLSSIYENENNNEDDNDNDNERIVHESSTNRKASKPTQEQIDENFEMLWSMYPRKKGKNSVSKKAKKEAYRIGYDHMARAIERYAKETEKTDQQYIMYGSTFFNSGYADYLDENYEPPRNSADDALRRFLQEG